MRLVFADSEVADVQVNGGDLVVRFSAAAVEPSVAGEEAGWWHGVELRLHEARTEGNPAACFGRLREGVLSDAVSRFTSIELPFDGPGPWRLHLAFATGEELVVKAASVDAASGPVGGFRSSYAC